MTDTRVNTAEKQKLSVIPKGHWRSKWQADHAFQLRALTVPAGVFFFADKYVSAEIAEQAAVQICAVPSVERFNQKHGIRYLGPVFFPGP